MSFSVSIKVKAVSKGSFKFTPFTGFLSSVTVVFFPVAQLHNLLNKAFCFFFFHISCQQFFFPTSTFKIYYVPIALSLAGSQ